MPEELSAEAAARRTPKEIAATERQLCVQQQRSAGARGWRFRMASHGGGSRRDDQGTKSGAGNMPGAVLYERQGDRIMGRNARRFGPGDPYGTRWPLIGLTALDGSSWAPQFRCWTRPDRREDGGANLLD